MWLYTCVAFSFKYQLMDNSHPYGWIQDKYTIKSIDLYKNITKLLISQSSRSEVITFWAFTHVVDQFITIRSITELTQALQIAASKMPDTPASKSNSVHIASHCLDLFCSVHTRTVCFYIWPNAVNASDVRSSEKVWLLSLTCTYLINNLLIPGQPQIVMIVVDQIIFYNTLHYHMKTMLLINFMRIQSKL